ncbi:MAG: glycosyltransferase [Verrucomicrobia bacterium]|nr:glycosyltransferase [Verrucomicrobiota bacterium]
MTPASDSASCSALVDRFDSLAPDRERLIGKNKYYHQQLAHYFSFFIPPGRSVLEVGCGIGQLLAALKPQRGVGIDLSPEMLRLARQKHPEADFRVGDVERLQLDEKFDYIVLSDLITFLHDVQKGFENLRPVCTPRTRLVISTYNYLWEPILRLGEMLGMKSRLPRQNWISPADVENLLDLAGFEVVRRNFRLMLPKYVPLLSWFCNRVLVNLPFFRHLGLVFMLVARPKATRAEGTPTCSVVIPARNERGNIEPAVLRTPQLGAHTELIFVEGNSTDGTADEVRRVIAKHPDRDIKLIPQGAGRGKGDAVRKGFAAATGDILMILDADLTVPPEELPKFYDALVNGAGEFIHGSRLVYPMEKQAMRFFNILGNKFFSLAFTYLLDQRFKDTLCGTKVLYRRDYEMIAANRAYFGDFDPFGDFDLLFGSAKLNLKIVEIPIHYRDRTYGTTNIRRWAHGWLLLRMCLYAMRKIKFV